MQRHNRTIHILLATITFLLGANLLVMLHEDRNAQAAVPTPVFDPAGRLQQAQVDQLTELNKKIDKLQGFLESGKLAVIVKEMPKAAN